MIDKLRNKTGRRQFVLGPAAAAAAMMLPFGGRVRAALPAGKRRFISLYFNGGWDVLLGPDSRTEASNPTGIDLNFSALAPQYQTPITLTHQGRQMVWGAPMAAMQEHLDVMTAFIGVNMNTVAHPAGRAYVNTFIPPSGVVPKGDSLATLMTTAANYDDHILPNVAIGVPSFNTGHPPDVTGIGLRLATEATNLVEPLDTPLSPETQDLLRAAEDASRSCVGLDADHVPGQAHQAARLRVRDLLDSDYGSAFNLGTDPALIANYNIINAGNPFDPAVIAATVWRLLETELATSVTAQIQNGLDTHFNNWETEQPQRLEAGFGALAALLRDLRGDDPNLDDTTVVAHSEFARTPGINGRGGRDHWFTNSILVFGGGLRRGVFGGSEHDTLGLQAIDLDSGLPSEAGEVIRPEHIGATLAAAAGLDYDQFRVEPLTSWIA